MMMFCIATVPVLAQTGRIVGTITENGSGETLIGASILIEGTSNGTATDLDGNFTLNGVRVGDHVLIISYIGYEPKRVPVTVVAGQTLTLAIDLVWQGVVGEEVLITAQARGQLSAINQQLQSNTITNVVSSDRIRELPDVNAAESIGRLPGVSIQRSGGEANRIAIRGLSPKYNTVTVNGVRVPSTGNDRSTDLSLISSNILDGIEVMKAITADKDADAVAGSVDLRLREAPEGFLTDLSAQGGYNQLQSYYGNYKFSGTVSDRFFENKLGVIATFTADRYDRSADKFGADYDQTTNASTGESEIQIVRLNLREEVVDRRRAGASLLLDYKIPYGKIASNIFYNQMNNEALNRVNQLFDAGNGRHHYDMQFYDSKTSIVTSAFSFEQDFKWLRYDAGVSYTYSDVNNPRDFMWRFSQEGNAYQSFERYPGMDPREVVLFITPDSSRTGLADVNIRELMRNEHQQAAQLNIQAPFRMGDNISGFLKVGGKLRWLQRENDQYQIGEGGMHYNVTAASNSGQLIGCVYDQIGDRFGVNIYEEALFYQLLPIFAFNDNYNRKNFLEGDYPLGYTIDPALAKAFSNAMDECGFTRERVNESRGDDYEGIERYQAAYVMSEINIGKWVTLIPGVRYEGDYSRYIGQQFREQAAAGGQQGAPTDLDTLRVSREHNFVLPMIHMNFRPTDWLQLRLARTETLSRPDFYQYVPISRIDSQQQYAFAGNSKLKPAHSVNYDASMSIYTPKVGLFTISAFQKSIQDHIIWVRLYTTNRESPDPSLNIPDSWLAQNPRIDTYINNPFEAKYSGYELDWQTNFWYLPNFLKGLVLSVNYTRIFSETKYQSFVLNRVCVSNCGTPRQIFGFESEEVVREGRMIDQPKYIANIMIGYDYKGFSTRLSYLFTTDKTNSINATRPILDTFTGTYKRYDLSVRQKVNAELELFLNLNNLVNTTDRSFQGGPSGSPTFIEYYGFSMDAGVRYRF